MLIIFTNNFFFCTLSLNIEHNRPMCMHSIDWVARAQFWKLCIRKESGGSMSKFQNLRALRCVFEVCKDNVNNSKRTSIL